MSDDLTLLPEVEARRALRGRCARFTLLRPYGTWLGRGALRVLRVNRNADGATEIVAGYESYDRYETAAPVSP